MKANRINDNRISRLMKQAVILALTLSLSASIVLRSPQRVSAAASQFDMTFGTGGKVSTNFGSFGEKPSDTVIQPDGKIVSVGSVSATDFAVARFNANGTLDITFDGDGKLTTDLGGGDVATSVAVQTDGKIIVAGQSNVNGTVDFALVRYNLNGSLDTTFDGDGIVISIVPASDEVISDLAIQPDGKIVVAGDSNDDFAVARYNTNGSLENSVVSTPIGSSTDRAFSVALQPDGKIVAAGYARLDDNNNDYAVARYNANLSLDNSFDTDGKVTTTIGANDISNDVVFQPDGKIVALGATDNNASLARYNSNGSLDPTFDFDGKITLDFGGIDSFLAVALQSNGKIVAVGRSAGMGIVITRFNSSGSLDTSFHGDGKLFMSVLSVSSDVAFAVVIQPDGKILLGISSFDDFHLVRLLGTPRLSLKVPDMIAPADRASNSGPPGLPQGFYPSDFFNLFGASNAITKVRVTLHNVTHTEPGDFDVLLVSPQGLRTVLMSDAGGGDDIVNQTFVFDQSATTNIPVNNLTGGIYKPFNYAGFAVIEPGGIDVFPAPGPGSQDYGNANLDVFNGSSANGTWKLYVVDDAMIDVGSIDGWTIDITTTTSQLNNLTADFDSDGKADVSVFRPSVGYWYISQSSNNAFRAEAFGLATDRITPADFDGDGKTDVGVWRPSTGFWYRLDSRTGAFQSTVFGTNGDIPTPADFDGDGRTDICVFRPSNSTFYLLNSSDGSFQFQQWGQSGDSPIATDYDGDGKADFGIYRSPASAFYYLRSIDGSVRGFQWGATGDKPIAVDFDADGKTDIAVYRPSTGAWYAIRSSDGVFTGIGWGTAGDIPSAGDYDGDGKADVAVFRPSTGVFYILQSTNGSLRAEQFGTLGDIPVSSAFVP